MRNIMPPSELIPGVMAHLFAPEEEVGFDQPKRDSLSVPCSVREGYQEGVDRSASCVSPEVDGKRAIRRRTQVACMRCRKRKIKCSGDIGDGQACSNCRTSGNTNCQFLRVNSSALQTKVHNNWPYPPMSSGVSPSKGIYAHSKSSTSPYSVNNPNMRSFSRSNYELGNMDFRQSYVEHGLNYEADPSVTQSPMYMSMSPSQGLSDYYGMGWNKAWSPALQKSNGLYQDETENLQSAYSYMLPQGTQADVPLAPTMTSLEQGVERTLPSPNRNLQTQTSMSTLTTSPEAISGLPFSPDPRIGNQWPKSSNRSMRMSNNYSTSPMTRTKSIPSNAQDMVFGFMPIPGTLPSSGAYTGPALDTVEEDLRDARLRAQQTFRDTRLSLADCSPDVYGYSSSEKRNRSEDTSTLMNGLPYTPVRHSDQTLSFNLLPPDLPDYRVPTEHAHAPAHAHAHRTTTIPSHGDGF